MRTHTYAHTHAQHTTHYTHNTLTHTHATHSHTHTHNTHTHTHTQHHTPHTTPHTTHHTQHTTHTHNTPHTTHHTHHTQHTTHNIPHTHTHINSWRVFQEVWWRPAIRLGWLYGTSLGSTPGTLQCCTDLSHLRMVKGGGGGGDGVGYLWHNSTVQCPMTEQGTTHCINGAVQPTLT